MFGLMNFDPNGKNHKIIKPIGPRGEPAVVVVVVALCGIQDYNNAYG